MDRKKQLEILVEALTKERDELRRRIREAPRVSSGEAFGHGLTGSPESLFALVRLLPSEIEVKK